MDKYDNTDEYNWLMAEVDRHETKQAFALAELLNRTLAPSSVIDIGCATGVYLLPFTAWGTRIFGVDGAAAAGQHLTAFQFRLVDLRKPLILLDKYDLSLCIEVAEHLRPEYADLLVESICHAAPTCFFSAAHPGQGGIGHFNEQPKEYWLEKFAVHGFHLHKLNDAIMREINTREDYTFERTMWLRANSMVLTCQ